jgi:transcriptional regulator with XRE-family HTH domain
MVSSELKKIGSKIREIRKQKKMSQTALASAAGVSRPNLNRIEKGRQKEIKGDTLEKIARALETDERRLRGDSAPHGTRAADPVTAGGQKPSKAELQAECISLIFKIDAKHLPVMRNILQGISEKGIQFCPELFDKHRS